MGSKSVAVAYILWFLLGWLGVHQFYLRRDRHAFFLWATLGGVGIGWLRDVFYIPRYVEEANESDSDYSKRLQSNQEANNRPTVGFCRWAASLLLGYLFAMLTFTTLWKDDINMRYYNALAVLSHTLAALGIYLVDNESHVIVPFKWCLLGAYIVLPLTIMYGGDNIWYASLVSSAVSYKAEWRSERRRTHMCKRMLVLSLIGMIYLGAVSTSVYYNASITSKGETVPLRDAVKNFFTSPAWKETKETLTQLYNYYKHHGWRAIWDEMITAFDPQGEAHAYEVLGVASSATQKEIKNAYKNLALKFHPDKEKDPEKKKEVADKFMEIQKAYDTLSTLKQGRTTRNEL